MNACSWFRPARSVLFVAFIFLGFAAKELALAAEAPKPRPRLTESLRAKVEDAGREEAASRAVAMDKVVVRASRVSSGPEKERPRDGPFSTTEGGYILKNRGEKFSTEVGVWRHVEIIEDRTEALSPGSKIRMDFLRIKW